MPLTQPVSQRERSADTVRHQRLLDVYGRALTEHQQEACRLYLDEDWSITELAEHLGCSRSGAHDLVRRAVAQLEHLESRLGLAAELDRRDAVETTLRLRLAALQGVTA
ncbi:MAG: RNA polymerase subunit sigma-70 [Candidatus Dormibacteraeota bacterium]|nr:RNA polymerase subunit sigma-70 [Candidatus Dormibacteraeota bacterium]